MMPTPPPRSAGEISLCLRIEQLQHERQIAYNSCEERLAKRLEFEIVNLMRFLQGRPSA